MPSTISNGNSIRLMAPVRVRVKVGDKVSKFLMFSGGSNQMKCPGMSFILNPNVFIF